MSIAIAIVFALICAGLVWIAADEEPWEPTDGEDDGKL